MNLALKMLLCFLTLLLYICLSILQAHFRGYKQRKVYIKRKEYLNDHSEDAVKVRSPPTVRVALFIIKQ